MQNELLHQYFRMMLRISFWKNRIEVSTVICGVPQNEQGILLLLQSLKGNKKA